MSANHQLEDVDSTSGIGGHPRGLNVLFFTELWERFSYYGMRAILMLFMVAPAVQGGLGFDTDKAAHIYGYYTMCVYLTSIPGGLIADRLLGPRKAILLGGIIIALGHFTMAFPQQLTFFAGMILIVLGTGLLKPNISTMVGRLYHAGDQRRDAGFSIFYMGINMGATLAPLVCGFLAQSEQFKSFLISMNIPSHSSWHFGFAAAGVGMCIGLAHLLHQYKLLDKIGERIQTETKAATQDTSGPGLSGDEWKKLGALLILFLFNTLFWSIYEQGGSSLNLFADKLTDNRIFGHAYPSSWFQSLQSLYVIILAPVFSYIWLKLADKQPSSPGKFALGLMFLSIGIGTMVPAAILTSHGKVGPIFLVIVYFIETLGELCLSPVGLSTVTKLAPARFASLTMGGWFVSTSLGNYLAGHFSSFFKESAETMVPLFGSMALAAAAAAGLLALLTPHIKKLMGSVR